MTSPVPSANEFRKMIRRDPGEPNLGDGTEAIPLKKEGKTMDISVSMGASIPGPFGKGNKFTVTNLQDGSPFASGVTVKGKRFDTSLYLKDGSGNCLAKIIKNEGKMGSRPSYKICAPKKFHPKQRPCRDIDPTGDCPYTWAKVTGDSFGDLIVKVAMYSSKRGGSYIDAYHSVPHFGGHLDLKGKPPISFLRSDGSYAAFLREQKVDNALKGPKIAVHIAPGMDPLLIICFVTILCEFEKRPLKGMGINPFTGWGL